ncbi:MAG: hypothetical protein UR12_C0010G0040 [candidate division TM6 bacterium GW2011_GWF2_30_66]|nr:MAG: hypothetical protein UR12_C0010G0040 [candidate division TM6 bacterium GW2011_GWF2_30_66]
MVKIFGKLFGKAFIPENLSVIKILALFLLINSFFVYCVKLDLKILSTDGSKLERAGVGVPFFLEVSVDGASNLNQLKIEGLENFNTSQVGVESVNINGHKTASSSFYVKIDNPGKYKIGPAKLKDNGIEYESSVIELEVADTPLIKEKNIDGSKINNNKDNKSGLDLFLKLSADKETAVFGEKINCRVRFYYLDGQEIKIDGIFFPEIKDMKILEGKKLKEPTVGTENINDKLYNYEQWIFTLVAKKTGSITVPAFRGVYVGVEEGPFGWPVFQEKSLYSNALSFNIESLPKYDGVVDAVGKFISFDASVDRVVAKQGDGIVYTLELEGLGDLDSIEIKELRNMPQDLKYYDSKRYLVDNSSKEGMKKKRFEFIVQGLGSGDVVIPSQTFTFFDTQTRQYKVLKSNPVNLNILPLSSKPAGNGLDSRGDNTQLDKVKKEDSKDKNKSNINIMPLCQNGVWFAKKQRKIDLYWFLFLIFIPIFLLLTVFLKKLKYRLSQYRFSRDYSINIIKKNSFAKALRNLKIAKTKNDFKCLHTIFVTFFAERFNLDESGITGQKMLEILANNNFSSKDVQDWEIFFEKIMAQAFCDRNKAVNFELSIFAEAVSWVDKFKQKFNN